MVLSRIGGASVTVQGLPYQYAPRDLVGGLMQGDQRVEILNDEIAAAGWPGPPGKPDRLLIDGRTSTLQGARPICEGSGLIGWSLWVRGG